MGMNKPYETLKIASHCSFTQRIQIARPESNNSINKLLMKELLSAFQAANKKEKLKIIVLEGLPEVFCTGMDFNELLDKGAKLIAPKHDSLMYFNILKQMSQSDKVILSVVRGKVQAGGVGLIAASDLVIADETATFVLPELLFGLLPACVLPFLIRRIGFQKAHRLALTTKPISVGEAYDWGLVDEYSVNTNKLLNNYIRRLRCLPDSSVKQLKDYMNKLWIIDQKTQNLAVDTISELIETSSIQDKIKLYIEEGIFPWQMQIQK